MRCFCKQLLSFLELRIELRQIAAAGSLSERLGLRESLDTDLCVSHCKVHTSALVGGFLVLAVGKPPVSLSHEILRVIAEDIGNLPVVKAAQVWIDLVKLEGFTEVDSDLCCDFREYHRIHSSIIGLLIEEVLSLREADVCVL